MPKVGEVPHSQDHYSDRSTPSPSGSVSHAHTAYTTWPPSDHYSLQDPISRTPSSGSNSPYPHPVNYDYAGQRLPSMSHSRDLMMPGSGSPSFNGASTPRDESLLGGFGSNGFPSPAPNGVNSHPSAALPPHSHSNANLLLNPIPASNRMVPNFLSGSNPSYPAPRRSVDDLGSHGPFPSRSASIGGLNGPAYGSAAPGGRLGLSPSPVS
jgi:hypothetical protein